MSPAQIPAGAIADAATLALEHEAVAADQVVTGAPSTGYAALFDEDSPGEIGVWEMTPGAMRDSEVDEVFVVLAGDATVEFTSPALPSIELRPGVVVRLDAGMQTVWTVRETLRKVFIAR
ncbi:cupin domain-containing protein [Microbacterium sp. C7(2022)]|uniref:cupin domain-containing protein n=1 Tax=Microbacterium sp. C7(2022) TaxID=2992759 RepID=UPI00237A41AB|nr:cupin domain-containing protein [Microbacterium sp. C7(2022)]MDE0545257.1 cupin domain-containing protein [Microbacterium sp. C7(2022)]